MNSQPARRLSVDVPSGLDCDTGKAAGVAVRADVTCTFVAAKPGLVRPEAAPFVGQLRVVSIGVPTCILREAQRT
jgi:NAD(P)H-hydrate epimerase